MFLPRHSISDTVTHSGDGLAVRSGREQVRRRAALVSKAPDLREEERSMQVAKELLGKGDGRMVTSIIA